LFAANRYSSAAITNYPRSQLHKFFIKVIKSKVQIPVGATENVGVENAKVSKMQAWKTREWNSRHQTAGLENAKLKIMEPEYRG